MIDAIEGSEAIRGAHSWLECEYLRLVAAAGLPAPLTQQVVTSAGGHLVRVDFRFPASPVVVEVLGYRYHRTPAQLRRDAERMNALVADGLRPYQFSYEQVVDAPSEVVAQTRTALDTWSWLCVSTDTRIRRCCSHRRTSGQCGASDSNISTAIVAVFENATSVTTPLPSTGSEVASILLIAGVTALAGLSLLAAGRQRRRDAT